MSPGLWICLPVIFSLIQDILFTCALVEELLHFLCGMYEGWNFNSGNYLFTTDTK